jgi:hypothetical protein
MQVYWKTLTLKIVSWIIVEVALNLAGLDNLANYGEFISKSYLSLQPSKTLVGIG